MLGFFDPSWPVGSPQYVLWFTELQALYKDVLRYIDPSNTQFGRAAPENPVTGLLAFADGTSWNPGSGEGYYRYTSIGTWAYVG